MTTAFAPLAAAWRLVPGGLALALASVAPAAAQSFSGMGMLPPGSRSAVGLQVASVQWRVGCGTAAACEDTERHLQLSGRSLFVGRWGAQVGLFDGGDSTRIGGDPRARGLNLSLVGRVPLGAKFSGWGRIGTTYGQGSPASAAAGQTGSPESGFGLSYGLGVSWEFTPRLSAVVEWDSHDSRFMGTGRESVRATSLGLHYRY